MKIDFQNTENAFKLKTTSELKRARLLFNFITKPWFVSFGKFSVNIANKLRIPYAFFVKSNIFSHFCAGERIDECNSTINKLASFNCFSILDYSAEGLSDEASFDDVKNEVLKTLAEARKNKNIVFGVFKFTGMSEFEILEKISAAKDLNKTEEKSWKNSLSRAEEIFEQAYKDKISVFVDAEETWIQSAIDKMTRPLMLKYNKEMPVVFDTIQMYTADSLQRVGELIEFAKMNNIVAGVKLVRGAYMEKERERAEKYNYASPIHKTKTDTDQAFNEAVDLCLQNLKFINVCIASHNEESNQLAVEKMSSLSIALNDKRVWFAQLYGMSDHISFNLSKAGLNVAKYLPYGEVKRVMPYLIRRAEENSSMISQTNRELDNIKNELRRRMFIKG